MISTPSEISRVALVRRPGPRLDEGFATQVERRPVDISLAIRQWEHYVDVLEANGWEIIIVPDADDCPDAVFVEDTMVVFRNVAVISQPGAQSRRPEIEAAEATVTVLGCSINRIRRPSMPSARAPLARACTCPPWPAVSRACPR